MGGGSSSHRATQQTNIITYARYIQTHHQVFLTTMKTYVDANIATSPFADYDNLSIDDSFFGAGNTIADYSSLFPLFETYVLDVDTDTLYTTILDATLNSQTVKDLIVAEGSLLNDDIETNALPRLLTGAKDINASLSSTTILGKELLEATRLKLLGKFSAELKYRLIPVASERWAGELNWKKNIVATYSELLRFYFASKIDVDEHNYEMATKNALWPFTVLDHQRAALAALQGAKSSSQDVMGSVTSKGVKAMSGALSGAAMGAQIGANVSKGGGVWGAVIGAVVGGAAGYYS